MEQFEYSLESCMALHNKPLGYPLCIARINTDNFMIEEFQHF